MTDQPLRAPEQVEASVPVPRAARRRRPGPGAVIAASAASFAMLFGFLTYQLGSGHDPAIGATSASSAHPAKVVTRRVIHRRVITTVVPPATSGSGAATSGSGTISSSSGPVVTSSAPANAPAPVTTSAS